MNIALPVLAGRLRILRQQCGKTQAALAAEFRTANIPITRPMLAKWESGRSEVPARFIPALAHVLAVRVADLLPDFATPAGPAAPSSYRTGRRGGVSFRPASEMNPADAAMCSETKAMLMNMIRTLDHRHREPFLLYHFDGLTVREIANKLNLPASNIQARVRRASEKLRCLLFSDPQWYPLRKELCDELLLSDRP